MGFQRSSTLRKSVRVAEKGNNETIKACAEDVEEIQARFVAVGQAYEEALKAIDELKDKLIEKEIFGSSQGKSLS